jgi:uncharacterized protein
LSSPDNPRVDSQMDSQSPTGFDPAAPSSPDSYSLDSAGLSVQASAPPPVENPVWNGWDVLAIAVLAFVAMIIVPFVVARIALVWYPRASLLDVLQKPLVLLIAQFILYIPVAAFMVLLVHSKHQAKFWQAIQWNWPRSFWKPLALGGLLLVGLGFLQSFLPMPKDTPFEHLFDSPRDALLISILAVTIGPLMEELFFRGFMYPVVARRIGVVWGILLTALPFGLIHLQQYGWAWSAGLVIFLVGVACGVVRAATRSVGASFLVHVGYNGVQMIIALVVTHGFLRMDKAVFCFW